MATTDLKFWDGSSWVSVGSVAGDLIRLPVASADGESQVNGADGLISIENTTPGGEAGMTFVTADDGTRWKANVVEGLNAGRLTFYNAANEAVFTLEQNGNVILEQGTGGAGTSATTRQFVESLMNTFPLLDEGRNADGDVISPVARIDTDRDTNIKEIYFGIGGSMQNPKRILTIRTGPENDELHITAHEDYTPTDPQDLVTLSYFQANDAGSLPISSADETVTLDSPAANSFEIKLDSGSTSPGKSRFYIDDETTTILPKDVIGTGAPADDEALTNALRIYTDASKNYIGFGVSSGTMNIAACNAVSNVDVYAKSRRAARFTDAGIFLYSDDVERFRLRGDGVIGIGDVTVGARTQGIRAVYNNLVMQNWISFYDSSTIPPADEEVNPDYIPDDGSRPDGYDPDTPETILSQTVKNVYGHWVQPRTADVTQSCTYYAFYAPAPVQVDGGLLKTYIGSAVENCTLAKSATSFQTNQRTAAGGTYYAFYASGSAPSRFNGGIQTDTITTSAAADSDSVISINNNQVDIIRASLDVSPMIGVSVLNPLGVGSDGIAVESADVFTAPEGWDDETQGDPAQQPDQPRSGIAFKGPYLIDSPTQNYYASIEGVRGGRTNGYKSGACRISVNSTGSGTPSMNTAAYFGWDQTTIKSGNDSVLCNTKWTSSSIVNQCTNLITKPISEASTGYLDFDYYDNSRASAIGWYAKDYEGGTVAGGGSGSTFFWANDGNTLALAADGVRINSQATGALTQYQWEFTTEGHLVSQGGQLQVPKITTEDDAEGDMEIVLNKKTASFQTDGKNKAVIGEYKYRRNNGDTDAVASVSSRNGTLQAYVPTEANEDYVAIDIYEGLNKGGAGQSIQWNNAGGAFADATGEIKNKRIATGSSFELTFSSMVGNSLQEYLKMSGGQLTAYTGYEPDNDESLVNKKYCDDAIGQAIAGNQDDETIAEGTPTNQNDPDSAPGSIMFDDSFLYLKTSVLGWRKVPLMSLNAGSAVASVTVQMTQAQYNALGTKDPNTLYVIVG